MQLTKIDDPRSNLQRARKTEILKFAKANGVKEINSEQMPAEVMRDILRSKGLTRIPVPDRPLGAMNGASHGPLDADQKVAETDANADLARQWQQSQNVQSDRLTMADLTKPVEKMAINELRAELKRRKIKLSRRDNMETMRAKLNGSQDAT